MITAIKKHLPAGRQGLQRLNLVEVIAVIFSKISVIKFFPIATNLGKNLNFRALLN